MANHVPRKTTMHISEPPRPPLQSPAIQRENSIRRRQASGRTSSNNATSTLPQGHVDEAATTKLNNCTPIRNRTKKIALFCGYSALLAVSGKSLTASLQRLIPIDLLTTSNKNTPLLQVIVYETGPASPKNAARDFIAKAEVLPGLMVHKVGEGHERTGWSTKWGLVRQALNTVTNGQTFTEDTVFVISDNRDVVPNIAASSVDTTPVQQFLDTFERMNKEYPGAVVISAEEGCCVGALTYAKPGEYFDPTSGARNKRACESGKEGCTWAGDEFAEPWKAVMLFLGKTRTNNPLLKTAYLNMGLIVAKKKDLVRFLDLMDLQGQEDDQAVATDVLNNFPQFIALDYAGELFGNNKWEGNNWRDGCLYEKDKTSNRLAHHETGKMPLFLHTSGLANNPGFVQCLNRFAQDLGYVGHLN